MTLLSQANTSFLCLFAVLVEVMWGQFCQFVLGDGGLFQCVTRQWKMVELQKWSYETTVKNELFGAIILVNWVPHRCSVEATHKTCICQRFISTKCCDFFVVILKHNLKIKFYYKTVYFLFLLQGTCSH